MANVSISFAVIDLEWLQLGATCYKSVLANNVKAGDWVARKRVDQGKAWHEGRCKMWAMRKVGLEEGVHEKSRKIGQEENGENRGVRSEKNRERGGWDKRARGTGTGLGARVTQHFLPSSLTIHQQTGIKMMNLLEDRSWVTWGWHLVHTWEDTPKGVPASSTSLAVSMMQHIAEDELHRKRRPILFGGFALNDSSPPSFNHQ
ncbi:hypothetical protein EI94DRAFT_1697340 [Lactarius quietus]|nr:hypothetical protein EI94DRAFT_1697340 [Lactarius quietus]